jgi:hypothetical protein
MMMEAIQSSKTLILTRATWHHISEDGILHRWEVCEVMKLAMLLIIIGLGGVAALLHCFHT